jgi:hypothetical protein
MNASANVQGGDSGSGSGSGSVDVAGPVPGPSPKPKKQYELNGDPSRTNFPPKPLDNRPDLSQCQPCDCEAYVRKYKEMLEYGVNEDYDTDLDSDSEAIFPNPPPVKNQNALTPSAAVQSKNMENFGPSNGNKKKPQQRTVQKTKQYLINKPANTKKIMR